MRGAWWVLVAACGCVPTEPARDMFAPRAPRHASAHDGETPGSDLVEGEVVEDSPPLTMAEIYEGIGLGDAGDLPDAPAPPEPVVPTAPVLAAAPQAERAAPPPPSWGLDSAVDKAFGVWLVSTVMEAQPPRAILAVADGGEQVVRAGTMLPDAGVVVLAIGRDAVQVARVTAEGDRATVQTEFLRAMYP